MSFRRPPINNQRHAQQQHRQQQHRTAPPTLIRSTIWLETSAMKAIVIGRRSRDRLYRYLARGDRRPIRARSAAPQEKDHEWPALAGELEAHAAAEDEHKADDPGDQEGKVRGDIEEVVDPVGVPMIGEIMVFEGLPRWRAAETPRRWPAG